MFDVYKTLDSWNHHLGSGNARTSKDDVRYARWSLRRQRCHLTAVKLLLLQLLSPENVHEVAHGLKEDDIVAGQSLNNATAEGCFIK